MNWVPMNSSWVVAAAWDGNDLYVEYRSGVRCRYGNIPLSMWQDFQAAPSKGKWVHANIAHLPYAIV